MRYARQHVGEDGFVVERENPYLYGYAVTAYKGRHVLNEFGAAFVVVCDRHVTSGEAHTVEAAQLMVSAPDFFCKKCRECRKLTKPLGYRHEVLGLALELLDALLVMHGGPYDSSTLEQQIRDVEARYPEIGSVNLYR